MGAFTYLLDGGRHPANSVRLCARCREKAERHLYTELARQELVAFSPEALRYRRTAVLAHRISQLVQGAPEGNWYWAERIFKGEADLPVV